ncbi:MAG: hypothetical protein ABID38_01455 [Candidatus Diapherotrites archaeon]
MDIGKMFKSSMMIAAIIAIVWSIISNIISIGIIVMFAVPTLEMAFIMLLVGLVLLAIALLIPLVLGFIAAGKYAAGSKIDILDGAITGIVASVTYTVVSAIVGIVFLFINLLLGIGDYGASVAELGLVLAIVASVIGLIIGVVISLVLNAIAAAIGGAIKALLSK